MLSGKCLHFIKGNKLLSTSSKLICHEANTQTQNKTKLKMNVERSKNIRAQSQRSCKIFKACFACNQSKVL